MMSAQDTVFRASFLERRLHPVDDVQPRDTETGTCINFVVIPLEETSITDASHPCAGEYPGFKASVVDDQHESCGKIWAATERKQNLRMHA